MDPKPIFFVDGRLCYYEDGKYIPVPPGASGGRSGGGGGNGRRGVTVQDEGTTINAAARILNFIGNGVDVTNTGPNSVDIDIPGYVIESLTTAQRLALVPTTALIVEDIDLDMYFKWSTVSNAWAPF